MIGLQTLKNDNLKDLIQRYQLGTDVQLDYDSTQLKEFGSYYKKFETNIGKGFIVARQDRSSIFPLGILQMIQKVINEQ